MVHTLLTQVVLEWVWEILVDVEFFVSAAELTLVVV
jgi:hypothetical protein